VKKRGRTVLLGCQKALARLLESAKGIDRIRTKRGESGMAGDYSPARQARRFPGDAPASAGGV
jgi:hypothetical protein